MEPPGSAQKPEGEARGGRAVLPLPAPPPLTPPTDMADRMALIGVSLAADQIAKIGDYLARLLAMNEHINLTSITGEAEVWTKHALDALTLVPHLTDLRKGATVLDMGSGGGVPGIIVAIARPDLRMTLVDATEKKVAFLNAVSEALGLDHIKAIAGRAEQLATTDMAKRFDVVMARALARIEALLPWTAPFVKPGGRVLLIKGEKAPQELAAAKKALARFRCKEEETVLSPTGRVVVLRVR